MIVPDPDTMTNTTLADIALQSGKNGKKADKVARYMAESIAV